ncbi:MAG TPA: LON peptidase substrate-binding domain-containing protein [Candidatus Acidoferrales bacterium]|jgi:Lon protease-like protein|nr:LON peptidase substrate-binding domain-containing protein [Candidatus Acidoferrales bacterium]
MQRPNRIPLFPLDVVLMPGAELPLHIFEPRYKLMIARCLDEKLEFGMILAANQAVAGVGCTAEIVMKIRDYPDGRMDILTKGRAVFRLTDLLDEKEYYEGSVEYVADTVLAHDVEQSAQLVQVFEKCHALLFARPWMERANDEPATLAYRMAALLPMEMEKRQALLEMRSQHERREFVLRWMERLLPMLIAQQRARERAGGNGHTLN